MWKIMRFFAPVFKKLSWSPFLLVIFVGANAFSKSLSELYPNRLITPDFGIVTADDLAYAAQHRDPTPYDPSKDLMARYWQCVPMRMAIPKFDTWRGEDGMGRAGVEIPMCTIGIHVKLSEGLHVYGDRRGHPNPFCQEFERNWSRLTRGENIVCLEGEDPSNENDETLGKYRAWVWDKFKTRKGCYSYFGDCDVTGCAKGKCAK